MIIIGMKFFVWGSQRMQEMMRCSQCGTTAQFFLKKGMRFITVFFVIPVIPISGISHMAECPNCKARYEVSGNEATT